MFFNLFPSMQLFVHCSWLMQGRHCMPQIAAALLLLHNFLDLCHKKYYIEWGLSLAERLLDNGQVLNLYGQLIPMQV